MSDWSVRYLGVLFALVLLAGCEWRFSDVPYYRQPGREKSDVQSQERTFEGLVAVAVLGAEPLAWRSVVEVVPAVRPLAIVAGADQVLGLAYRGSTSGTVQEVWLGSRMLTWDKRTEKGAWSIVVFDNEAVEIIDAAGSPSLLSSSIHPAASWLAHPEKPFGTVLVRRLPELQGARVCTPDCTVGDLIYDSNGHFLGVAGGADGRTVLAAPGLSAEKLLRAAPAAEPAQAVPEEPDVRTDSPPIY